MKRYLIKPSKEDPGNYEVWHTSPWWDLLNTVDMPMIVESGTIEHCINCILKYVKSNYIDKFKIIVRR